MVVSTGRKKPHCRTCGMPMEGHKRNGRGSPVCPSIADDADEGGSSRFGSEPPLAQSSPLTKPKIQRDEPPLRMGSTPPPELGAPSTKPFKTSPPRQTLVIPESGPWHWRNPNWVENRHYPRPPSSRTGSLVPTVLVDSEGNTIRPERGGSKSGLRREETTTTTTTTVTTTSLMLMDRLASMGGPAASIFNTKWEDLSQMRTAADRLGFHTGVVHKRSSDALHRETVEKEESENDVKAAFAKANQKKKLEREREHSWWFVMGQNKEVVQGVVDSHQRGLPGSIASTRELMEGPKQITTFQVIVAGVISALLVLCGLSML